MPEAIAVELLSAGILAADKTAIGRALNLVEDRRSQAQLAIEDLLAKVTAAHPQGAGHRVGMTGPPGVGKSTLTAAVARELRGRGQTVGILAIDPSSTRSGGALLGDRARMSFDPADAGLFVRSLSTAGDAGGLSYAAHAAADVLAAAFDTVMIETTGVGQSETDVEHIADTVCLVIQPGSGDVLQFIKAGIMEIPDVLVVNKADHGRLAKRAANDLAGALAAVRAVGVDADSPWRVPVCLVSARDGQGIEEFVDILAAHRAALGEAGVCHRRRLGSLAWACALFERKHGEHGVSVLGGRGVLRARATALLGQGQTALTAARELSGAYLAAMAPAKH